MGESKSNNVYTDTDGWKYVLYDNKRIYFPKEFSIEINRYFLYGTRHSYTPLLF